MNIEQLSTPRAITREILENLGRPIQNDLGDKLFLVNTEVDDQICGVLFHVPDESDVAEFVCAGRNGVWMRDWATVNFIPERRCLVENEEQVHSCVPITEDVVRIAMKNDYRIVGSPLGLLEMNKENAGDENDIITISNPAWSRSDIDYLSTPEDSEKDWLIHRVISDNVGAVQCEVILGESVDLNDAINAGEHMGNLEYIGEVDNTVETFESLASLRNFDSEYPQASPSISP